MDSSRPPRSRDGVRQPVDGGPVSTESQEQEWAREYLSRRAAILRAAGVTRVSWQHAMRAGLERSNAGDMEGLESAYRATVDFHRYVDRQIARLNQTAVPAQFEATHRELIEEAGQLRRVVLSYEQAFRPGFFRQYGCPDARHLAEADRMLATLLSEQRTSGGRPDGQPGPNPDDTEPPQA